jgi:hypothetical protein
VPALFGRFMPRLMMVASAPFRQATKHHHRPPTILYDASAPWAALRATCFSFACRCMSHPRLEHTMLFLLESQQVVPVQP